MLENLPRAIIAATILFVIIKTDWQKFGWYMQDRCTYCGGELVHWSSKKSFCSLCDKRN